MNIKEILGVRVDLGLTPEEAMNMAEDMIKDEKSKIKETKGTKALRH